MPGDPALPRFEDALRRSLVGLGSLLGEQDPARVLGLVSEASIHSQIYAGLAADFGPGRCRIRCRHKNAPQGGAREPWHERDLFRVQCEAGWIGGDERIDIALLADPAEPHEELVEGTPLRFCGNCIVAAVEVKPVHLETARAGSWDPKGKAWALPGSAESLAEDVFKLARSIDLLDAKPQAAFFVLVNIARKDLSLAKGDAERELREGLLGALVVPGRFESREDLAGWLKQASRPRFAVKALFVPRLGDDSRGLLEFDL